MPDDPPTAAEIRATLVDLLAGATGSEPARWERVVGEVTVSPIWANPRSNWAVSPKGTAYEIGAVRETARLLRELEPYAQA